MKLYHVSEESDINQFSPRLPSRKDLNQNLGLVWALCERTLPNFLTPRNCPRVTCHVGDNTVKADIEKYMSHGYRHAVIIENEWHERLKSTTLYIYEFDAGGFYLQDECAGYYVSEKVQNPIAVHIVNDLVFELEKLNTALLIRDNLWDIADEIKTTSLNWSICRMGFAKERDK